MTKIANPRYGGTSKKSKNESKACTDARMDLEDKEMIFEEAESDVKDAEEDVEMADAREEKACDAAKTKTQMKKCFAARGERKDAERTLEVREEEEHTAREDLYRAKQRVAKACKVRRATRATKRKTRRSSRR